jgi:hypothetical protein
MRWYMQSAAKTKGNQKEGTADGDVTSAVTHHPLASRHVMVLGLVLSSSTASVGASIPSTKVGWYQGGVQRCVGRA